MVAGEEAAKLGTVMLRCEKLNPPMMMLTTGIMMLVTNELTMSLKAVPMTTPTARSMALPELMNSLNSLKIFGSLGLMILSFSKSWEEGSVFMTVL